MGIYRTNDMFNEIYLFYSLIVSNIIFFLNKKKIFLTFSTLLTEQNALKITKKLSILSTHTAVHSTNSYKLVKSLKFRFFSLF